MRHLDTARRKRLKQRLVASPSCMGANDNDSSDAQSGRVTQSSLSSPGARGLEGLRILVAEDEFLVAVQLGDDLRSAGCTVIGPFGDLALAMQAARTEKYDLAILDINLAGQMVYPLADDLIARGAPFIFVSGYGEKDLPERFRPLPRIAKPHDLTALVREIKRLAPKNE